MDGTDQRGEVSLRTSSSKGITLSSVDIQKFFDLIKAILSLITLLAGVGFFFVLVGWIIVSTYVKNYGLYGLTEWSQRFLIDANISFVQDWYNFLFPQANDIIYESGERTVYIILSLVKLSLCILFCMLSVFIAVYSSYVCFNYNKNCPDLKNNIYYILRKFLTDNLRFNSLQWLIKKIIKKDDVANRIFSTCKYILSRFEKYFYEIFMLFIILSTHFLIYLTGDKKSVCEFYIFILVFSLFIGAIIELVIFILEKRKRREGEDCSRKLVLLLMITIFMIIETPFLYGRYVYNMYAYAVDNIVLSNEDKIKYPLLDTILTNDRYERYLLADYSEKHIFFIKAKRLEDKDREGFFFPVPKNVIKSFGSKAGIGKSSGKDERIVLTRSTLKELILVSKKSEVDLLEKEKTLNKREVSPDSALNELF